MDFDWLLKLMAPLEKMITLWESKNYLLFAVIILMVVLCGYLGYTTYVRMVG